MLEVFLAGVFVLASPLHSLWAQPAPSQRSSARPALAGPAAGDDEPGGELLDTSSLGTGRYSQMSALLERTIFQVDVLTVTVRVSPTTEAALGRLFPTTKYSDSLADSVATVILEERDAWARLEFRRGVSLNQLVDGIADNMEKAVKVGWLDAADFEHITALLPVWFDFLAEDGPARGDQILYRIRGDELRTVYRRAGGEILLDQTDVGAHVRAAVLGSYFAPDSDFREGLIKSLLQGPGE